jgi:hypothetical protein
LKIPPTVYILIGKMFRKPAPKKERRRQERRTFPHYMQFKNDLTGELVGDLADISLNGFRLEGTHKIPLNAELQFRVDMPPDIPGRASIVFVAKSRWMGPHAIDPRLYVSGYQIVNMEPADSRSFEEIFAQCGAAKQVKKSAHDYVWQD